jgi:hypothetical protein
MIKTGGMINGLCTYYGCFNMDDLSTTVRPSQSIGFCEIFFHSSHSLYSLSSRIQDRAFCIQESLFLSARPHQRVTLKIRLVGKFEERHEDMGTYALAHSFYFRTWTHVITRLTILVLVQSST